MDLGIVTVNYKTAGLTIECLQSLVHEKDAINISVVIVDNNSQDGSFEQIRDYVNDNNMTSWVEVIDSSLNGGFSYGNNIGLRHFLLSENPPDYLCLLNPDTKIHSGAMRSLVDFMEGNPSVGLAGSRLEDPDGTPQLSAFRFHTWLTELDRGFSFKGLTKLLSPFLTEQVVHEKNHQTDWVAGASMIIRPSVFDDIGLLDESYFMYYEELDFCLKANRAGWSCWYVPESRVIHYVGQSSGITDTKIKAKRLPTYWFESRRRYFLKNFGVTGALMADAAWLAGFGVWRIRNFFQNKPHNYPPSFWKDSLKNSVFFKGFSTKPVNNSVKVK